MILNSILFIGGIKLINITLFEKHDLILCYIVVWRSGSKAHLLQYLFLMLSYLKKMPSKIWNSEKEEVHLGSA